MTKEHREMRLLQLTDRLNHAGLVIIGGHVCIEGVGPVADAKKAVAYISGRTKSLEAVVSHYVRLASVSVD